MKNHEKPWQTKKKNGWISGKQHLVRNLYTRGREHTSNYQKKQQESLIQKHQVDTHNGVDADFTAKVVCSYKDCLSRQIAEGGVTKKCWIVRWIGTDQHYGKSGVNCVSSEQIMIVAEPSWWLSWDVAKMKTLILIFMLNNSSKTLTFNCDL